MTDDQQNVGENDSQSEGEERNVIPNTQQVY